MKISLNWLKKFVKIKVPDEELIRLIGARLVEVEGVIDETHKYDKIFVARVEKAEKIPDTHLTKCTINVGSAVLDLPKVEADVDGLVQVMCGAPNVREGMLAVWIAPGAIVPASVKEDAPFVIGKRKMLGQYDSYGMLAGADELDFGDDHSGIVEIDPEKAEPGDSLADVFELNDLVLEIENKSLTHRPDCFGMIGFAREVAGILGQKFEEYDMTVEKRSKKKSSGVRIEIQSPEICPRYTAVVLKKHGELKKKYLSLQDTLLAKAGMRPIDPIVDATNYLMLLTGQPLHAFDYDKFLAVSGGDAPEIGVRLAREGEKLELLDDSVVELNGNDIVICSGDEPVALAGAMGGKSTEIDENTRNIIIEAATFSLYNLRKTQMAHGIFSEAITRFTKGQPAYQTLAVADACAELLSDGFEIATVGDEYPEKGKTEAVKVEVQEINDLLGTKYSTKKIADTLKNVGFGVKVKAGKGSRGFEIGISLVTYEVFEEEEEFKNTDILEVKVPEWRTDIHIKEDIIEEVGRLNGYDNIKPILPRHETADRNELFSFKREIRELLAKYGANEVLTYSFVSGRLIEKAGQDVKNSYRITNSISPELQYVRQSIVPSLLEKTYVNEKLPVEKFVIFEMNKVYRKKWGMDEEAVPVERNHLGLVVAERKGTGTAYYKAKKYVDGILEYFGIRARYVSLGGSNPGGDLGDNGFGDDSDDDLNTAECKMFEKKRAAKIIAEDGSVIGYIGELRNSVKHEFKLAEYVAGAEVDVEKILGLRVSKRAVSFGVNKTEDVTIETEKTYAEVFEEVSQKYPEAEISPVSIYQAPGQKSKNISFRIKHRE